MLTDYKNQSKRFLGNFKSGNCLGYQIKYKNECKILLSKNIKDKNKKE